MKVETICSICLAVLSVISLLLTFIKSWRCKKRQAILATTAGDTTNAIPENDNDIDELNKKIKIFSKIIGYICEAEKVFAAYDKIPSIIWEDEYRKYSEVLQAYQNVRVTRWSEENTIKK